MRSSVFHGRRRIQEGHAIVMRSPSAPSITIFLVACIFSVGFLRLSAQAQSQGNPPDAQIIIKKVAAPVLSPIARIGNVYGDVEVTVGLRPDGSVELAVVNAGARLLQQTALESARASVFECRGCRIGITENSILYRFLRTPDTHCLGDKSEEQIIQGEGEVTVINPHVAICDYASEVARVRVRSLKCLFLWKCGYRRF